MATIAEQLRTIAENIPKVYEAGQRSAGANIDVTAEVGQTIVVKEVDENGKPTKWEAADMLDAAYFTEWVSIPWEDFVARVGAHKCIVVYLDSYSSALLRVVRDSDTNDIAYAVGHISTATGAVEFHAAKSYGICEWRVEKNTYRTGKAYARLVRQEYAMPNFKANSAPATGTVPVWGGGNNGWFFYNYPTRKDLVGAVAPAQLALPAEYLVDGATFPVGESEMAEFLEQYGTSQRVDIVVEGDNSVTQLPAIYVHLDFTAYSCTVKCISPTTGGIITLTFVLST